MSRPEIYFNYNGTWQIEHIASKPPFENIIPHGQSKWHSPQKVG